MLISNLFTPTLVSITSQCCKSISDTIHGIDLFASICYHCLDSRLNPESRIFINHPILVISSIKMFLSSNHNHAIRLISHFENGCLVIRYIVRLHIFFLKPNTDPPRLVLRSVPHPPRRPPIPGLRKPCFSCLKKRNQTVKSDFESQQKIQN